MTHDTTIQIIKQKNKTDLDGLLMSVGEAFISLNKTWQCTYVNDWATKLLQKNRREIIGKIIWDIFPELTDEATKNEFVNAMAKRTSMSIQVLDSTSNKWLKLNVIPHDNGIDVFYTDITKSKLSDIAKAQIEKRFVKAFESCPIPLSISRQSDDYIVDANDSFLELFEFSKKEVVGSTLNLLKLYSCVQDNSAEIINCLGKDDTFNKHELVLYSKNRKPIHLIFSTELIQIDGEDHILSTYIDVTEKLKSQKIIAESEEWFRSIADNSPVMIWGSDNNQSINYVNSTWIDFTGRTTKQILESDWAKVIHPDDLDNFQKTYSKAFDLRKSFKREYRLKRTDGKYRWVYDYAKPILMPDGSFKGYIGSCTDIHTRRTLNTKLENLVKERTLELMQSLEKEKSLNEAKSRFVSMASHEFRTPLSSILSSVFLVEKYTDLIEKANDASYLQNREKHISRIKKSINHLTEILNDFLSLDKLDQGKIEAKQEEFNLLVFTEELVEEIKGILKYGQTISYKHQGDSFVFQDKNILKNIYINLLSNAIKYSQEEKEITLEVEVSKKKVILRIADKGIGIPLEDQNNLFTKFFRAGNALNIEGTGLGLNIVKRYVELIGGTISFSSTIDQGTEFTVQFPRNTN
jgi:PAS domain S-box-containing protein